MSNPVHLVVTSHNADGLGLVLRHAHGAMRRGSSVQRACPAGTLLLQLDRVDVWEALRYTELNPVRSGLASRRKRGSARAVRKAFLRRGRAAQARNGRSLADASIGGHTLMGLF